MKKWFGCLVICMVLWGPGLSQAEDTQKDKKMVSTMEEVVVTAGRVEEKKKEITANVTIIDEEEIKMSSATDLGDLLAEKGIGHIQKYPGTLTAVGIRGMRTDSTGVDLAGQVLILLNGRRAGTGNLAKIMTKNIERVEIIRGPASVQYGSAAMGGVVNVITKKGKGKPGFFVEGGLGSFDYEEGTIGTSGKYKAFDFSGSFTRDTMDDYDTADGEDYGNTGYDEKENASLNLGFEFLPKNHIRFIYNYFDADEVGEPYYLSQNDLDNYTEDRLESIDFIYDGETPGGLLSWKARYFSGENEYKWCDPDPAWPYTYEEDTDHQGAQGQVSLHWKDSLITGGFDWINYEIDSSSSPEESEYDNPSYFILAKTKLFDKLIVTGGLRYDDYEVDPKADGKKEDEDNLSSNFGVAYLVTDYLKIRANYGEAFKMPTPFQLFGDMMMWPDHYVGNPDLEPEESETYECGLDLTYASANLSVTYFYTDFDDIIEVFALSPSEKSYKNIGSATIEGFEGEISFDIGAFFDWDFEIRPYGSIVYLTEYEDDKTDEDLKYTEDINASWGIIFSDMKGLSANLNFAYTGEKDVEDWENWSDPVDVIKRGGFTVTNFTISKKILDFDRYGNITLKGKILNLFDKDYAYIKGYPMPGRSFFIGMRYDY